MSDTLDSLLFCGGKRACGERGVNGGLYACCPVAATGIPLEEFVLDPARPFDGTPFRAPMFAERADGYYDLVIWVGEGPYPFVPDVLEEGRSRGFSRKVPPEGPYDLLTPFVSQMLLVHPKAITTPTPELPESPWCGPGKEAHGDANTPCTFHLWPLSALRSCKGHEVTALQAGVMDSGRLMEIVTPSVAYSVRYPEEYEGAVFEYRPGAVAALPLSHFEYINKESDEVPVKIAEKVHLAGYQILVCKE